MQDNKNTKKITEVHQKSKEIETLSFINSRAKFGKLYRITNYKWKIIIILLMGMVIGTVSLFFVKNSGLYSLGFAALTQGLSRIITTALDVNDASREVIDIVSSLTFWFFLLLFNIPLLIFSWKKIGHKFTLLTLFYLVAMSGFGFALDQIPNVNNVFLLGEVKSFLITEKQLQIEVRFLTWNKQDISSVVSLLFYGVLTPLIVTGPYAIIYILGGSTGGSDIVSIYYFKIKLKSIGKIFFIVNLFLLFLGYFLGTFLTVGIGYNYWNVQECLFGPNFVCSLIIVFLFSFVLELLYPRYKMVSVKCIGKNAKKVNEKLNEVNYIHNRTLYQGIGSYTNKQVDMMEVYCFYTELGELIDLIRNVDEDILIIVDKDIEINGKFKIHKFIE